MRVSSPWALAFVVALVLTGCNTQNAEPPPRQQKVSATAERPPGPRPSAELPPRHPPIGQGLSITGRISLAPGLAGNAPAGAVLFIIARRPGSRVPVAVARLQPMAFPVDYTIGPQDLMIPSGSFEGAVEVSARLDRDGLIGPLEPGDLTGAYPKNPVSVGGRQINFTLDKRF